MTKELFLTVPCEPAKGPDPVRPIHVSIVTTEDNKYFPGVPYVISRWKCPHCGLLFHRAQPCRKHMGLVPNMPAYCPVLLAQDAARRTGGADRIVVTLTPEEYAEAEHYGRLRRDDAVKRGRIPVNGMQRELLKDVVGCLGEKAYSKWSGKPWTCAFIAGRLSSDGVKPADFGNVDVKAAPPSGHLLLQKNDPLERDYVLATAQIDHLEVALCGWLNGRDAKKKHFWGDQYNTGRPCYWVPPTVLQPMGTLKI